MELNFRKEEKIKKIKKILNKKKKKNGIHLINFILVCVIIGFSFLSPFLYYSFFLPTEYDVNLNESLYSRSPIKIGAAINLEELKNNNKYREIAIRHFNTYTAENIMKMRYLFPTNDTYFFEDADFLVDFAKSHSKAVHGHCLVWHQQTPSWLANFTGGKQDWMNLLQEYIYNVVGRYKGEIESWDVVNEAVDEDGYRNTTWFDKIGPDYIRLAFQWAHEADPDAKLYYNDYNICYNNDKLNFTLEMIRELLNDNVPIHGIGLQAHINSINPTIKQIENSIKKINELNIDLRISELDISMNKEEVYFAYTKPLMDLQSERYYSVVKAFSKSERLTGITLWGIDDGNSWITSHFREFDWPLLFDKEFNPKPAALFFQQALNEI